MIGRKNLFGRANPLAASTSGGDVTEQPTFSFPSSLTRLILNDCHLICTNSFPLSFRVQPVLQYLNLANSLFQTLPCYTHLENLRVLNLSFCYRLTCLERLPNTLAELFVYDCELLERISFQSPRFTLQEFGYEGCINLYEIEGFIKLVPIAKLDETDLGHMNWLKEYQNLEVCLVGDDQLTVGRSWHIQMLYEFNIMSISLPDIKDPNMAPDYTSKLSSLSFDVPPCPENKRLKGINVTFKYAISGNDCSWFCKTDTTNGVDYMYNPRVFGKPEFGKECIWLSYWPIGNELNVGDTVHVSIAVLIGLEIHECGVSLVYSDEEIFQDNIGWEEIIGGDLSGFQLSTGVYYLCRHDFFELMEVGRLTPNWFRILVGDTIDYTEIRGWRKTGRPKQVNPSFTELKTIRCVIDGPQLEDNYNIAKMSKSHGDISAALTTSLLEGEIDEIVEELKSGDFTSTFDDITIEEPDPYSYIKGNLEEIQSHERPDLSKEEKDSAGMSKVSGSFEIKEFDSPPHGERSESVVRDEYGVQEIKPRMSESPAKGRLVRCPRCKNVLLENTGSAVYKCGGCGAILRVKIKGKLEEIQSHERPDLSKESKSLPSTQETSDKQKLKSSDFTSTFDDITIEEYDRYSDEEKDGVSMSSGSFEIKESDSPLHGERYELVARDEYGVQEIKKHVLAVKFSSQSKRRKMLKELSALQGVESVDFDKEEGKLTVIGDVDQETVIKCVSEIADDNISSVEPSPERQNETLDKFGKESVEDKGPSQDKSGSESSKDKGPSKDKNSRCSIM